MVEFFFFGERVSYKIYGTQHMKNIPNKQISGCQHTNLEMSLLDEKFNCNMIALKNRTVKKISSSNKGKYLIQQIWQDFQMDFQLLSLCPANQGSIICHVNI